MKKSFTLQLRHLLSVALMCVMAAQANAQGTWTFAAPTDGTGSAGAESARSICSDASGNVYIVGVFNGAGIATDFDLTAGGTNTFTASSNDGFIASYDVNGNLRWKTIVSGTATDFGAPAGGICTNGTYVWVAGSAAVSTGAPVIASSTNTVTITSPGTGVDALAAKLNCSNGGVQWVQGFGGTGALDFAEGICVDPAGNCYVTGSYSSAFTLGSISAAAPGGTSDFFVAKFDAAGTMTAFNSGGATANPDMIGVGGGICYVPGGTPVLVATGHTGGSAANFGSFTGLANSGANDAFLLEIDPATLTYTNALSFGSAGNDELISCAYDAFTGAVFVCGYNSGALTFPGTAALVNNGGQDIMVGRYAAASNNFTWSKDVGSTSNDRAWCITSDGQGGILMSGYSAGAPCDFGNGVTIGSNFGLNDLYVMRYNTSGTAIWGLTAASATSEECRGISSYVSGGTQTIFATGIYGGAVLFGSTTLNNDGGNDFFLAKINDATLPLSATQSQVNLTCNGVCTGSATVVASGGTAPYTYSWSPSGGSGATASSLCATNYTCTITDAASTSITKTFNITQPPAIVLNASSQTNVACFGGSNGAASVNAASGGTGSFTYNWTPGNPTGDGTVSVSGLTAGSWTCTVTDANSCTATRNFTITQPPALNVNPASQTNISCFGGSNGAASVSVSGGTPSYSYNWTPGNPTGDGTAAVTGLTAGTWTCTVTDLNGCTGTRSFTITAPTAIVVTPATQTNISCFGGTNGAASINTPTGGAGGFTYNWTPGNPAGDGTVAVTGLSAGTWTCTVTDANSCTATQTFNITAPSAIVVTPATQTNISCFGGSNGAASINTPTGGAGGFTYNWTPGNPTGDGTVAVTGLTAGTWTCTVTDANSCTAAQTFNITAPSAIVVTPASQTNISCFGGSNGAASINTPTGGAGGYTYNWTPGNPTGDGTVAVTGLTAGTWTCTVTDANSCTATQTFNITAPSAIVVTPASQTNISCFGGSNGAASINTPTGGAGGYTYNWTPGNPTGDGTLAVTGLTAGTWTCTVTDANSCTATQTFNITAPTALVVTPASQTNVSCFGLNNGAASINTPTGGAGGYTYNWTPGNPTGDGTFAVTGLTAGTWTCTVTDANSCTATQTFNITAPTALVVTAASQTNVACNGGSNGAASINTPTGGAGGYTYNWTPGNPTGDGTVAVTGLNAVAWTCTVTDANGCIGSQSFTITAPTAITASSSSTPTACASNTGTATVSSVSGGAGGYTYSWAPSGGTAATATGLAAGSYTCTITDANGCTITKVVAVTGASAPTLTAASQTNIACFGGSTGAASVNAATGGTSPYTYNWTPGNPTGDGTVSVSGLTAGTWTCTVTDAGGCTATQTFNITAPSALVASAVSQTNVSCFGGSNGAASVSVTGGTISYSYNWTPGNPTGDGTASVTGLTATTWTCTVTDANGCTATQTFNITAPTALVVTPASQTNVSCFGGSNGAASVSVTGGTTSYSYNWTPGNPTGDGTASITGLAAQTWTCTVTDANSCTSTQVFSITSPTALVVSASSQTNVACNGGSNGAASINTPTGGAGGYTYNWTPGNPTGDGTVSVNGLTAGTWTCTVTDANSCTGTQSFTITAPTAITASSSSTPTACSTNTGTATVSSVTGGAGGYTYLWTPSGGTAATATGLAAGSYTCTITDANGCTITKVVTVSTAAGPSLTAASQTNVACFGGSTGAASVNAATGGTSPYTYNWTPGNPTGDGTVSVSGLSAGTWTCTVTDAGGCTATQTFNITAPTAIVVTAASQTNVSCNGGSNGAASINTPTGGAGGYTYNWTPGNPTGDGTVSVTGLTATTWTCTVTDANGCTATRTFTITAPTALVVSAASQTNVSCNGGSNGAASVSVTGGTTAYSYNWTPGNPTGDGTASVTGLTAGTWTCTVTDANGCSASQIFTVTQPPALVASAASQTNVSCFGGSNGAASVTVSGGTTAYSYNWTPGNPTGDGTASVTGLTAGTWTCTVTDANSCTATQTFTITQPPVIVLSQSHTNVSCFGTCNGTATITPSGGTPGYTYNWVPSGGTGSTATGLCAGTYTCTVTDANGCTQTQPVVINTPTAITTSVTSTNVTCFGLCNGTATVTTSGGTPAYTYAWAPTGGTGSTATGLCAGTYTCTVTDANGCTHTQTVTITQPTLLTAASSATSILCNGGTATVTVTATGGTAPYTGAGTFTVTAGTYNYTVTDVNGCTATTSITVTQPTPVVASASATSILCNGGTSTITVSATGGTAPYTGTGTFTVSAGNYNYTVTDANGCTATTSISVTEPTALTANASATSILCFGGTADVTVTATGGTAPYTGEGTFSEVAGTYTYTVTDANGCSTSTSITVTEPTVLNASSTATSILCNGGTATVTVAATGGTAPYTGEGTFTVSAGTYTYTVTDANGCSTITNITVVEPSVLTASSSATAVLCNGGTADVTVTAAGGTAPYTGEGTFNVAAGTYNYTVTDANGCTATTSITVTEPTLLTASSTATSILCNGGTADITVTAAGGTSPYTGEGTMNVTAGTYTYTVTDANGCTATTTITLTEPTAITATTSSTNSNCGSATGTATVVASGGTGAYGYSWSSGGTADTESGLTAGSYTVTITDGNGCSSTAVASVSDNGAPTVSTVSTNVTCNGGNDGAIDNTVTGGLGTLTFAWSNSATTEDISGLIAGTYNYTVTDSVGCQATGSVVITEPSAIDVTTTLTGITVAANNTTATAYQWIDCGTNTAIAGETNSSFTPTVDGSYAVVITEGACSDTSACVTVVGTGIAAATLNNELTVYPNPNSGAFTIKANTKGSYVIVNGLGQIVRTVELNAENNFSYNVESLDNGVYFITGYTNAGTTKQKIIVTK